MAMVYFDSSAFVKLLVEENESEIAAALWDGCDAAVSSRIAYPEVRAAIAAAGRDHRLSSHDEQSAAHAWDEYWGAARPVEFTASVSSLAGQLAGRYALRGADATHLASASVLGDDGVIIAVWDERLRAGAQSLGFRVTR